jgi:hypothetical protein
MSSPVLTQKMVFNLLVIFASVGTVAATLPISKPKPIDQGSGIEANVPFDREMLGVFLPK